MRMKFVASLLLLSSVAIAQQSSQTTSKSIDHKPAVKKSATVPQADSASATAGAQPKAIIHTSMGDIHCVLYPDKAPIGAENFIGLATGTKEWKDAKSGQTKKGVPLYDGTIFHRVIPGFMIQGGDPMGSGMGGPGYKFKNENSDLSFDVPGRLAYANAGPDTNGSQFFITERATAHLNGGYTIFGQCEDQELVQKIARVPRNGMDRPDTPVVIKNIEISGISKPKSAASTAKKPGARKKSSAAPAATPNK